MAIKVFGAGSGQSLSPGPILVKMAYLVGGSANATASIKGNGTEVLPLAALIGSMGIAPVGSSSVHQGANCEGPVTVDVVGTGAKLVVQY